MGLEIALGMIGRRGLEANAMHGGSGTDLLMHSHSPGMLSYSSVHLGKQAAHLECGLVQFSPDSSQIVADVFCEMKGSGAVAHAEAAFNELPPDGDDGGRWPGGLRMTRRPEVM
jgi:hypothetical protein